jgi:hypothetical protein
MCVHVHVCSSTRVPRGAAQPAHRVPRRAVASMVLDVRGVPVKFVALHVQRAAVFVAVGWSDSRASTRIAAKCGHATTCEFRGAQAPACTSRLGVGSTHTPCSHGMRVDPTAREHGGLGGGVGTPLAVCAPQDAGRAETGVVALSTAATTKPMNGRVRCSCVRLRLLLLLTYRYIRYRGSPKKKEGGS